MEAATKQHIVAPLAGISNIPSDFACEDNSALFVNGVRTADGELKAMQTTPATTADGYEDYKLVFIHECAGGKRLIYLKESALYWADGDEQPSNEISSISVPDFEKIVSVGSTMVILYSKGIAYATWNGTGYSSTVSNGILPNYRFWLKRDYTRGFFTTKDTDSENYSQRDLDDDTQPFRFDNNDRHFCVKDERYTECWDLFKGIYNERIESMQKKKHFLYPFFAVAALKLFDGTYKFIGTPQLMMTFTQGRPIVYYGNLCYNHDYDSIDHLHGALIGEWALHFKQYTDLSKLNTNVNGVNIISSIDIFVTHPTSTHEFDEDIKDVWQRVIFGTETGNDAITVYFDKVDDAITMYQDDANMQAPDMLPWSWSDNDNDNSKLDRWISTFQPYKRKSDDTLKQDLLDSLGQFRKIASIPWVDTENGKCTVSLADRMEESTLQTLDNQDLLTFSDKYEDWVSISIPDDINAVNRRLIKISGKQGFVPASNVVGTYVEKENNYLSHTYAIRIKLNTTEGIKYIWEYKFNNDLPVFFSHNFWYYYPDPRATELAVYEYYYNGEQKGWHLVYNRQLVSGSVIGGAYSFNKYPTSKESPMDDGKCSLPTEDNTNDLVSIDNQVTQSPVDNVFADTTKTYVGQGDIIKLATLTTALTQDAYKVSTVLAFTTQGIWSITCGSDGTFTSVSPSFSREVCINKHSIVMTDSKVFFASKKGIMCVVATAEQGVAVSAPNFSAQGIAPKEVKYIGTDGNEASMKVQVQGDTTMSLYDYYEKINNEGVYVYDYYSQSILMLCPGRADYFALDINTGTLAYCSQSPVKKLSDGTTLTNFTNAVDAYPDTYLVYTETKEATEETSDSGSVTTHNARLSDTPLRQDDTNEYPYEIISRPMKLGGALLQKSLRRIRKLIVSSRTDACAIELFATNDLSKPWVKLSSLGGKPYRYYMYRLSGKLNATDSLAGLMLEVQTRYTDKPH